MPKIRNRAFIVLDLDGFEGDAADLANWIQNCLTPHDVTVYGTFEDMAYERAVRRDIFQHEPAPIPLPPEEA